MSSSGDHLEKFVIPLEEIRLATRNFNMETHIRLGGFESVYRGQLQNRTVAIDRRFPGGYRSFRHDRDKLKIISTFHHKNIIPFIGYCHEGEEIIAVFEYPVNESLDEQLYDYPGDKIKLSLTWADRLKICIRAARGLEYLHSGCGEDNNIVIHRNVNSRIILLGDNLEAKISEFSKSILVDQDQPQAYDPIIVGIESYIDPLYEQSGIANRASDVYSLGVVLFEMVAGMLANHRRSIDGDEPQKLITLVRRHYDDGLHKLIDPAIRDEMTMRSFKVFKETAYQCISWNSKARPTMGSGGSRK